MCGRQESNEPIGVFFNWFLNAFLAPFFPFSVSGVVVQESVRGKKLQFSDDRQTANFSDRKLWMPKF